MNDSVETPPPALDDHSLRFLFEDADIRGQTVCLDGAYRDIVAIHQYAPGVSRLLGEFLAAAVLLSTTLKFQGKLILQVRSQGQVPLLMVECNSSLEVRGIARGAEQATSSRFEQLLGSGQLAITIDPTNGQRYQGIVPLTGSSLAHSLDAYFEQSEQLKTRFWLAADEHRARGLLLQQLPSKITADSGESEHQWEHACSLAATIQAQELLELAPQELLYRLYHQDPVRLFSPSPVVFHCSCSRERTRHALSALDPAELEDLLEELGSITMDCEFCNQQYRFDRDDLADVLGGEQTQTLH
jgi:molecular chaperone Hsp33